MLRGGKAEAGLEGAGAVLALPCGQGALRRAGLKARRATHFAPCVRYVQTSAASQLTKRVGTRAAFNPTRLRQALLTARTLKPSLGFAAPGVALLENCELRTANCERPTGYNNRQGRESPLASRHPSCLQGRARAGAGVNMRSRASQGTRPAGAGQHAEPQRPPGHGLASPEAWTRVLQKPPLNSVSARTSSATAGPDG
jgi:hypothetical protein